MRLPLFALLFLLTRLPAFGQLYADFQTTSGNFSCELNYQSTPRTVANFVTLAEGSRPWLDERTGLVSSTRPAQPFYDGITFHRVVNQADFKIIQAGSRKGDGTDGPGYSFADEFQASVPASYQHNAPYLLSMANAGLNTNGSQFFITGGAIPALDGIHTVFGRVISGQNVIDAILSASTDSNDKPTDPITIQHVTIRRIGQEAQRFNASRISLPKVTAPRFRSSITPAQSASLSFSQPVRSQLRIWSTEDNGTTWEYIGNRYVGYGDRPAKAVQLDLTDTPANAQLGFRPVITTYPTDAITPGSLVNQQLYLENESGDYTFHFRATNSSYLFVNPSGEAKTGTIRQYSYEPEGYGANVIVDLGNDGVLRFRLAPKVKSRTGFTGLQRGSFYNFLFGWIPYSENSNFALSPLPVGS